MAASRNTRLSSLLLFLVKVLYIYCVISILLFNVCYCLFEDQVGLFDWRKQYIGRGKEVYFEQVSHSSKRTFISTEANVLAALNARTGQIVWRKIFERKDGNIDSLLHNQNILMTVSGQQQKKVRSWDKSRGNILWERVFIDSIDEPGNPNLVYNFCGMLEKHHTVLLSEANGGVLVSSMKHVLLLSQTDGTEVWDLNISRELNTNIIGVVPVEKDNKVIVIAVKNLSLKEIFINFKHVEIETGKLIDEVITPAPWLINDNVTCELVLGKYFVCADPKSNSILVKSYTDLSREAFQLTYISQLKLKINSQKEKIKIIGLSRESTNDYFTIYINYHNSVLANVGDNRVVSVIKQITKPGKFVQVKDSSKTYIFSIEKQMADIISVKAYESSDLSKTISTLESSFINEEVNHGAIDVASLYIYSKKNELNYRVLISFEDFTLSLLQNIKNNEGKVLWSRNEGLSTVNAIKMIELPPSVSASKLELLHEEFSVNEKGRVLNMFLNRIKSQIRQFQAFTESLRKRQRFGDQYPDIEDSKSLLSRDQFNIVKMIITFTEGRKIFAINSQDGEIVWSKFLSSIHPTVAGGKLHIFEQRSTAHFPLPPQCLIIAPFNNIHSENITDMKTVVYSFNPLNGKGLESPIAQEEYEILHVAALPYEDDRSLQLVAVIDTQHHVHIYPDTKEAHIRLNEHIESIYIYLANKTSNSFKGYKIKQESKLLKLYEVWSVHIPSDQQILSLKNKRSAEVVNSVGRVLGDHTVLYKYLNPNLVAIVTHQGSGLKGSLFIYLVDAITGNVVYQARHKGVSEPVDAILSEHWLVYIYYNTKGRRFELSVAELYEGYEEKNHTAFSSLDPLDPPMVLSQSYLLPISGFRHMTSTCTERGITSKNILIGLDNGYIYSIPKNILDPRRSFKQTQMLQEEGLPPYIPELPLIPQGYINYNQTVFNIKGIHTSAAGLESTSLVLVYGLDLYFTRVTPSKMFDVLKEDFDYIFISGVLSALILASIICSKLASMRSLKLAWQ